MANFDIVNFFNIVNLPPSPLDNMFFLTVWRCSTVKFLAETHLSSRVPISEVKGEELRVPAQGEAVLAELQTEKRGGEKASINYYN